MSFDDVFRAGEPEAGDEQADEDEREQPAWFGPPEDELGVAVPQTVVLARSEHGVVALSHVVAYENGAAFHFRAIARGLPRSRLNQLFHEQHVYEPGDTPAEGFLRIGVELADGTLASNLAGHAWHRRAEEGDPAGPVFTPTSGGGGTGGPKSVALGSAYWLWPLPPPGPLRVSCEWPVVGIALSTAELDASSIVAASRRAARLWSD